MDDGWLLFDGVFLRLPIFVRLAVLCCCSLAICGVVAQAAIANSIATLRHYIGGFTALRNVTLRPCVLAVFLPRRLQLPPAVCSLHAGRRKEQRLQRAKTRCTWKNQEDRSRSFCLLVSYRPASSASIELIELNRAAAWLSERPPLTPSPRRLVVGPASNAAVRPHKLSSLLPESMLSRADVSYSRSHHTHNSADHA